MMLYLDHQSQDSAIILGYVETVFVLSQCLKLQNLLELFGKSSYRGWKMNLHWNSIGEGRKNIYEFHVIHNLGVHINDFKFETSILH